MTKETSSEKIYSPAMKQELTRDKIRRSIQLLYLIAALNLLIGIFEVMRSGHFLSLIFCTFLSIALVILAILARKNPVIPMIIAFVILTAAFGLEFLRVEMVSFFGMVVRIGILMILGSGIFHLFREDAEAE